LKATGDAQPGAEVVERTVKRLLRCGFWCTGKVIDTSVSMLVEDTSRNKRFSQVRISNILRFISICDLFTDSPSYKLTLLPWRWRQQVPLKLHSEINLFVITVLSHTTYMRKKETKRKIGGVMMTFHLICNI
jgi:hypothetical protein